MLISKRCIWYLDPQRENWFFQKLEKEYERCNCQENNSERFITVRSTSRGPRYNRDIPICVVNKFCSFLLHLFWELFFRISKSTNQKGTMHLSSHIFPNSCYALVLHIDIQSYLSIFVYLQRFISQEYRGKISLLINFLTTPYDFHLTHY